MAEKKIDKLDELLADFLKSSKKTVIDQEVMRLTAAGDNYGSLMLAVKVQLKNEQNGKRDIETLDVVAKLPPGNLHLQKVFNSPVTFRNEVAFYKILVPHLQQFVKESGVEPIFDIFPNFYGGRLTLNSSRDEIKPDDIGDDNSVLLLENLKNSGFDTMERTVGFDFEQAKCIIIALARFHAVPLALKLLRPEDFKASIKPFFKEYRIFDLAESLYVEMVENMLRIVEMSDSIAHLFTRARQSMEVNCKNMLKAKNDPSFRREPFTTIIHADAWVNNFMLKLDENKLPIEAKLVDFQLYELGTPGRDLIFFIYSSIQPAVFEEHYDEFFRIYYEEFVRVLEGFGCDTRPFSWDEFRADLKFAAQSTAFWQCLMMLAPILATGNNVKEQDDLTLGDMMSHSITDAHRDRVALVVKYFAKENWI